MTARPNIVFALCLLASIVAWEQPAQAQDYAHMHMHDSKIYGMWLTDQLEYGFDSGPNPLAWDVDAWVGGNYDRLWFRSEGEQSTNRRETEFDAQLLYSRMITPFWDFQVGLGGEAAFDDGTREGRGFLVVGFEGLARHWFEFEPLIFVSHRGDVSARVKGTYDILFTQRLILQARGEIALAVQRVAEFGVGRGFNELELGGRLRYEFLREVAPYIGVSWQRVFGDTARLARNSNDAVKSTRFVTGLRFWF